MTGAFKNLRALEQPMSTNEVEASGASEKRDYELSSLVEASNVKISRRTSALYTLKNRIQRYSKRLLLEGLKIAKESGLQLTVDAVSEDYVDAQSIIALAKNNYPSLYRRYMSSQKKYFEGLTALKSFTPFKYRSIFHRSMDSDSLETSSEAPLPESRWTRLERLHITVPLNPRIQLIIHPYIAEDHSHEEYTITHEEKREGNHEVVTYAYPTIQSSSLEFLIGAMAEAMGFHRSVHAYTENPTKAFDDKIDIFLRKHIGIDYTHLAETIDIRSIQRNDYALVPPRLRRKIFDFRATVYLIALASAEEKGYILHALLEELAQIKIFPLKKELEEPTFTCLKEKLWKS